MNKTLKRLQQRKEIEHVLRRGRMLRGRLFSLRFIRAEDTVKFAVIVGKKVDKRAVIRNGIRRRIREALRLSPVHPQGGFLLLFQANGVSRDAEWSQYQQEMAALLSKLPIWKPASSSPHPPSGSSSSTNIHFHPTTGR
ncbi:ribonuclease P protein component [Candidatus Uhrbacteria bacterium]|nr:ribonuclease P protein component [Candidatus Uhrbacteria bacterium]